MQRIVIPVLVIGVLLCVLRLPLLRMMADGMAAHQVLASSTVAVETALSPGIDAVVPTREGPACCSFEALPSLPQPLVLAVAAALVASVLLLLPTVPRHHDRWKPLRPPPQPAASRRRALLQAYLI